MVEVELKFRLSGDRTIESLVELLNAHRLDCSTQVDTYFQHPARDFRQTDEAFRIRSIDERNVLTYKGPLLDHVSKTREETEIAFAEGPAGRDGLRRILTALGFVPLPPVVKRRTEYEALVDGLLVHLCHDRVDGLGEYVELETLADEDAWPAARDTLLSLGQRLTLGETVRRSYLQLLEERRVAAIV